MTDRSQRIAAAFLAACLDELAAPKPGNVHRFAAGHHMQIADFEQSAAVAAPPLCRPGAPLGARIFEAVAATRRAVGQNTNLGIILLCAPLAMAAERSDMPLRAALGAVLEEARLADAEAVFRAIALAAPAGLGRAARYDVHAPAQVPLKLAMAEAAGRDLIARQWHNHFADIFGLGLTALAAPLPHPWPIVRVYLSFLAAFPDSHVARKWGGAAAAAVQREGQAWLARLEHTADPATLLPELLAWDAALKSQGINPGTSADLTVASLFAKQLLELAAAA
jgi:triphosphoribosyl-dephospho-CoA synthase